MSAECPLATNLLSRLRERRWSCTPLEILDIIFEEAANYRSIAVALCQVSKENNKRFRPRIYEPSDFVLTPTTFYQAFEKICWFKVQSLYVPYEFVLVQKGICIFQLDQLNASDMLCRLGEEAGSRSDMLFPAVTHLDLLSFFPSPCYFRPGQFPKLQNLVVVQVLGLIVTETETQAKIEKLLLNESKRILWPEGEGLLLKGDSEAELNKLANNVVVFFFDAGFCRRKKLRKTKGEVF
ncbi:hypothetical protein M422DRAFT_40384 [Sphaerobolus stellatus SS14]|nr:hypothetical protein M422DRAFT_40384 [Sphaerobolus stellatus SS14]